MSTNAETFTNEMAASEKKCFEEINGILQVAYKSQKETIRKYIFDTIERYFPGFQRFDTANYIKLSNLVDDSLEALGKSQEGIAASLSKKISTHTLSVGNLAMRQPIKRASSALSVYTHELISDNSIDKIDVEKDELKKTVCRFLNNNKLILRDLSRAVRQGEPWDSVSMRIELDIESFLNKSISEIKRIEKNQMGEMLEGYTKSVISIIDNYLKKLNIDRKNRVANDASLAKAGYKMYLENTGVVLETNEEEKFALDRNRQGELTANEGNIIIREGNHVQIINGKSSIIVEDNAIFMGVAGDFDHEREIEVEVIDDNFEFYYQNQKVTDQVAINGIIEAIKDKWPSVYKEFEKSANFKSVCENAKTSEVKSSKFYLDEDGNVRINEEYLEDITQSAAILGYQVVDNEDGVYFEKDGVSSKVKYTKDVITLDNEPDITIQPDLYIYGNVGVVGPIVNYQNSKEGVRFFGTKDFSKMNLFLDEIGFFVRSDGTNVTYMVKKGVNEIADESAKEMVEEAFDQFMPEAYVFFKQNYAHEKEKAKPSALGLLDELDDDYVTNERLSEELDMGMGDFNPLIDNEFLSPEDMVTKNIENLMAELEDDREEEYGVIGEVIEEEKGLPAILL